MRVGELAPGQRVFLDHLLSTGLAGSFCLSGGTALSAFHLHHRQSDDLDLFSRRLFDASSALRGPVNAQHRRSCLFIGQ